MQEVIINNGVVTFKELDSDFVQFIEVDSESFMIETSGNVYNFFYNDTTINGKVYNNFSELPL
jgi:hypothetical protein